MPPQNLFHLLFCESDACLLPAPLLRGFFFFSLDFIRLGIQKRGEYLLGKGLGGKPFDLKFNVCMHDNYCK